MVSLLSPSYDLRTFCDCVLGKHPYAVVDAASAELTYARRHHCETTKNSDFRKGSKGKEYCDNLQRLINLIMHGSVPDGTSDKFLQTVKPLMDQLLQTWDVGGLREVFANLPGPEILDLYASADPLVIVISRPEVEARDTGPALGVLKKLTGSPGTARRFFERVDIAFHGYDQTQEELFEIPDVRDFVYELDQAFPFWLFFLSKHHLGLQCLLFCFLPPFLTEEARATIFPERINSLLTQRWFPAMNQICEYVGFSEAEIERLSDRAVRYIIQGRFPQIEYPGLR